MNLPLIFFFTFRVLKFTTLPDVFDAEVLQTRTHTMLSQFTLQVRIVLLLLVAVFEELFHDLHPVDLHMDQGLGLFR